MRILKYISALLIGLLVDSETRASISDTIRFAFLTDLHVSPGNENESGLRKIIEEINSQEFDFVVVTGDISNSGSNEELITVKNILQHLRHTLYIIPGNHETNWSESAGLKFNEIWQNDRFDFELKGFCFIGLNSGPFMKMGDGHIKNEDLEWLKGKVKQFSEKSENLIAFVHYPLSDGLDNWYETVNILKQGKCKLVFCGHGHRLALFNFNGIPGIMGRALFMKPENSPGYQIVEIRNDSVFVYSKVYNKEGYLVPIRFNYLNPDTIKNISVSPLPDYSVNQQYPKDTPIYSFRDSASVFAGLVLYKKDILIYGTSEGSVKALDLKTGKILWRNKFEGPIYSNPALYKKTVIVGTSDGRLTGIDAENGKLIWQNNFKVPFLAEGIVENNSFYIGCGDSVFVKIDPGTGKIIWKFKDIEGAIQGKPALSEKYVVFGAWDTYLYCLDKEKGQLVWKWNNGKKQKLFSPGNIVPAISHGKVFLVAPDRYMTALELQTGKEIWRNNQFRVRESMGISEDGNTIYAKLMNDSVIAVSALVDKFELLWAVNVGFGYEHSPCPIAQADNIVIVSSKNGLVAAIDEKEKKVIWKNKAGNSEANKIWIDSKNNIWITFVDGQIRAYRIGK